MFVLYLPAEVNQDPAGLIDMLLTARSADDVVPGDNESAKILRALNLLLRVGEANMQAIADFGAAQNHEATHMHATAAVSTTIKPGNLVMPKGHPECWTASVVRIEANHALLNIKRLWLDETEDGEWLWRVPTPPVQAWVRLEGLEQC